MWAFSPLVPLIRVSIFMQWISLQNCVVPSSIPLLHNSADGFGQSWLDLHAMSSSTLKVDLFQLSKQIHIPTELSSLMFHILHTGFVDLVKLDFVLIHLALLTDEGVLSNCEYDPFPH